ncbi:MAG: BadF/BadG/BcrA/BcrD ATPase family protein [Acidimicrobiia bacterium]|nr:BadF/BadG/BcrA/BcrD ATPase family protein [Acidimicrobiia bacterium]
MSSHFIGVDAGGTTTRAVAVMANGRIVGMGRAPGANTWSSGTSIPHVISAAIRAAIGELEPTSIAAGVIAVAGAASARPGLVTDIEEGWKQLGIPGSPNLVPDVLAAYAAGTTAPTGLVLAAGTGAIAAVIDHYQVTRRAGGHGWLVGDEGSAVWLGIEAIRASLRAIDGTGPTTALITPICQQLHIDSNDIESLPRRIVAAAHSQPPAQLGQLAPAVIDAHESHDPIATTLVETAARHLTATAKAAASDTPPPKVVLAGSLLTRALPIRALVQSDLAKQWPSTHITETRSGEAGAAAIAIAVSQNEPITDATLDRLRGANHQDTQTPARTTDQPIPRDNTPTTQ